MEPRKKTSGMLMFGSRQFSFVFCLISLKSCFFSEGFEPQTSSEMENYKKGVAKGLVMYMFRGEGGTSVITYNSKCFQIVSFVWLYKISLGYFGDRLHLVIDEHINWKSFRIHGVANKSSLNTCTRT